MTAILVKQTVKDFREAKKVYDSQSDFRISSGMLSDHVYRDESNPNQLFILLNWDSVENAKKFSESPRLRESMEKAGVIGRPDITFLNEV